MDKIKIKIRKAEKTDINEIAKIFKEEFAKKPFFDKWSEENALKKIKGYFKDHDYEIYVAEVKKEVAGFLIVSSFQWTTRLEGYIDQIAVSEKFQGLGVGKMLMSKAENYFRKNKIKEVTLYTERKSDAARFYEKIGYKKGGMVIYTKRL